jgi:hypothetical protein
MRSPREKPRDEDWVTAGRGMWISFTAGILTCARQAEEGAIKAPLGMSRLVDGS